MEQCDWRKMQMPWGAWSAGRLGLFVAAALLGAVAGRAVQAQQQQAYAEAAVQSGAVVAGEAFEPNIDEHVVLAGDTLWDVTARVVGKPWLWPRVWALNPQIANPHWVYPGDVIRFYDSNEPLPAHPLLAQSQIETFDEADEEELDAASDENMRPAVEVVRHEQRRYVPRQERKQRVVLRTSVSAKAPEPVGEIDGSVEPKTLLTTFDQVYIRVADGAAIPKVGDRLRVYHQLNEVRHPTLSEHWGALVETTGILEVKAVLGERRVVAELKRTLRAVERGQLVAPLKEDPTVVVVPRRVDKAVAGVVLAVEDSGSLLAGNGQVVFVDKGSSSGLERGHRLLVFRSGDPLSGQAADHKIPVASLLVVDAKDNAAACLVVDAAHDIAPGYDFQGVLKRRSDSAAAAADATPSTDGAASSEEPAPAP